MLNKTNRILEKLLPFLTPLSVVMGVFFSSYLHSLLMIVPWIFAFMTFSGAIHSSFSSLKKSLTHPVPILVALFVLHLLMPAWAWAVGHITFSHDPLTVTGLILAAVIPTGITSFIWVTMLKGNVALTLSIILIDTLLSPFVVPTTLSFFVGSNIEMDVLKIMKGLFLMIVIPCIIGMLLNHLMKERSRVALGTWLSPLSKLGIVAVIMINSSDIAPFISRVNLKLLLIASIVFFIALCGYLFAWGIGRMLKIERSVIVTLIFTAGMRNIGSGVVIAVSFFSPKVAVPVVMGLLFQQMLASFYVYLLSKEEDSVTKNELVFK